MRHALVVLAIVLGLPAVALGQGAIIGLRSYTDPTVDGVLGQDEWEHPDPDEFSSESPGAVVDSGSFAGASDARLVTRVLLGATDLFVAVRVFDDVPTGDDAVSLEIGEATFRFSRSGAVQSSVAIVASAVTPETDGFTLELQVLATLLTPTTIPGSFLQLGITYDDDDGGDAAAEGVLSRAVIGASFVQFVSPTVDLLAAAALLDAAAQDPTAEGKPAKQADRLEKAAADKYWADEFLAASKSAAGKSLDLTRKVAKKVDKTRTKFADEPFAGLLDAPLALMERAARFAAATLLREAIQNAGREDAASAIEKWDAAEASTGPVADRIKLYRKAAKKAAKFVF